MPLRRRLLSSERYEFGNWNRGFAAVPFLAFIKRLKGGKIPCATYKYTDFYTASRLPEYVRFLQSEVYIRQDEL